MWICLPVLFACSWFSGFRQLATLSLPAPYRFVVFVRTCWIWPLLTLPHRLRPSLIDTDHKLFQCLFFLSAVQINLTWLILGVLSLKPDTHTAITVNKVCNISIYAAHPRHIPWPCTGVSEFQRSRTWRPRMGSLQKWGCPSRQTPAGSGSSGSDSACWSSSWQNADVSLCDAPGRQPWGEYETIKQQTKQTSGPMTHNRNNRDHH